MRRVRISVEVFDPHIGWTETTVLPLTPDQADIVGEWVMYAAAGIMTPIPAVTGLKLWEVPDEQLHWILSGDARDEALDLLREDIPELESAIAERFGRDFLAEIIADRLADAGMDGEAFKALPETEQNDFLERLNSTDETKH